MLKRVLLGVVFCALALVAAPAAAQHHRGLPGEFSPHHGWSSYGQLTLDIGGDRYYIYDQAGGEFSATVIDRATGTIKIRGISIPGAGLFYYPAEASPCEPDALERMGLYAELALFYLSSAFPGGPTSIEGSSSAVVDRPIPELHFMQGLMKPREGARTLVSVSPQPGRRMEYVLRDDKDHVKGTWDAMRPNAVIPDDEPLLEWHNCWAGTWATPSGGLPAFKSRLENPASLKTFGEVRSALRQGQRAPQK